MHKDAFDNESTKKDCIGKPTQDEIDEFLTKAGLIGAQTRITCERDNINETTRKRFVYAEVINEALELIGEKHGWEDSCGVELGMGNEEIYGLVGLDY